LLLEGRERGRADGLRRRPGQRPRAGLPLGQSLLIAWPQIVGLVAGTIVMFVASYIVFQRQEVRA
jgi:ABC-type transport system involved in multi-copper enzyme maturation permease subunit